MSKVWKVSELKDQRGYAMRGSLRIYPMKVYSSGLGTDMAEDISRNENEYDAPLTGDSLIAALRERGVEVIDDTQPDLGGPDDAAARKWAEENGYEVVGYRLPRGGEIHIANYGGGRRQADTARADFRHANAYILTPKAKPVESKPDKWANLPEGGEWVVGINDWLWHFPTRSNCGTCYIPSQQGKPASFGKGYAEWPGDNPPEYIRIISRAEAIAIFEANAKPEVKPAETPAFKVGDRVEVVGPFDENWNLYVKSLLRCIGKVGTVWRIDSDGVIHTDIALGSHGGFMFHPANLRPAPVDTKAKEPAGDEVAKLRKELDEANRQIEEMFRQRDDLVRQRDSLAGRIDELNGKLDAIEQPPMSDERFRQEAAIAAMQGMIARDADREASLGSDAEYYAKAANALLAAMKGGAA
jgi:hypothetical protein